MAGIELGKNYPRPIVDHVQARNDALAALKMCNASRGASLDDE
jgi:deoxyribodipyrimidine photolyase